MAAPGRAAASGASASLFARSLCGLWLCALLKCVVLAYGREITCACTTQHCREQGTSRCNTTSMCYTQYLQSRDPNTDPITRGCINSRTPLLCENRRPAVHSAARWPQLICCSSSLCNQGVLPPHSATDLASPWPALRHEAPGLPAPPPSAEPPAPQPTTDDPSSAGGSLSPVHVAVLAVGACALFILALLLAVALVRRHAGGLFGARYVRGNYIKGRRQSTSEDSAPNGGTTYDNKMAVVS